MQPNVKIATCCYCSARTVLKPTARDGHELACGSCGAPLHNMKWLKAPEPASKPAPTFAKPVHKSWAKPAKPRKRSKPKKRRKSLFSKALEEAWDFAEDIFD